MDGNIIDFEVKKPDPPCEGADLEGYKLNHYLPPLEADPHGTDPHSEGAKLDHGKPQVYRFVMRYFPDAVAEVSKVSAFGAQKYVEGGWRTVPDGVLRYTEAMTRHILAESRGERTDPDSDLAHAAHVAWNALARLQLMLNEKKTG